MIGNRGVSHTLGFALTFGIIITSIGIVSTVGYDQLDDIRTSEQQRNAERAMELLQQNVDGIHGSSSVRLGGEIDLNDGSLRTLRAADSTIQVNVTDVPSDPESDDDYYGEFTMGGVSYQYGDTDVVLEGGALFRQDRGGIVVTNEPTFVCADDRATVSLVTIWTDGERQVGSGTISTNLRFNKSTIHFPRNRTGPNSTDGRSNVTVRPNSEFADGWNRYLSSDDNRWDATGTDDEFVCDGPSGNGVERYTVVQTVVNLSVTR